MRCRHSFALAPSQADQAVALTEAKLLFLVSACRVRVLGGLKVGRKKLFVYHGAKLHELTPDCV